jgi:hypothetical protein
VSRSRKIVRVETRNRIALGNMAHYEFYEVTLSPDRRVITLTAQVIAAPEEPAPPRKRTPRKRPTKKAATAAAASPQEQE